MHLMNHEPAYWRVSLSTLQKSADADGPVRRVVSRLWRCAQRYMLGVINCMVTVVRCKLTTLTGRGEFFSKSRLQDKVPEGCRPRGLRPTRSSL